MFKTRILGIVLAASVLTTTACASDQPRVPLLEKKFQRAAATYQKFDLHGQPVYCKKDGPSNVNGAPGWRCLTEAQLREEVRNFERRRNEVAYNHNIQHGGG